MIACGHEIKECLKYNNSFLADKERWTITDEEVLTHYENYYNEVDSTMKESRFFYWRVYFLICVFSISIMYFVGFLTSTYLPPADD